MLKQLSIITVLSLILLYFAKYVQWTLGLLNHSYELLNQQLARIFSHNGIAVWLQSMLSIILIPLALSLIPLLLYWLVKRKSMPYYSHLLWGLWLICFTSFTLMQ